jgi:NADH-quinone oxidoreductase subunit L
MTSATFAIAGFPPFAAFFSKDAILWQTWASGNHILWLIGIIAAGMTSFYMFRLWFLTFFGEYRGPNPETAGQGHNDAHDHAHTPHESPWVMVVPLIILGILSLVGGWVGVPAALGGSDHFEHFLAPVFENYAPQHAAAETQSKSEASAVGHEDTGTELLFTGISVGVAALGFLLAWYLYHKRTDLPTKLAAGAGGLYRLVLDKYRIDELYGAVIIHPLILLSTNVFWKGIDVGVIDRGVDESAAGAQDFSDAMRRMQSGNIRSYAGWVAAGAAVVIAFMVWRGLR